MEEYRRIELDGKRYYGKHLIFDAKGCSEAICDISTITQFIQTLVPKIDMVAYGDPVVARFGGGIEIGISAVQLIETSAIVIHTNDQARDLYLDVFSCKDFSEELVLQHAEEYFSPGKSSHQVFLR